MAAIGGCGGGGGGIQNRGFGAISIGRRRTAGDDVRLVRSGSDVTQAGSDILFASPDGDAVAVDDVTIVGRDDDRDLGVDGDPSTVRLQNETKLNNHYSAYFYVSSLS